MKVTKDNITSLKINDKIYIARSFNTQLVLEYIGNTHSSFLKDHMIFSNGLDFKGISLNNPNYDWDLKNGQIFTTLEECYEKMRELCLDTIDHYNSHQLKDNPIIVQK